MNNERGSPHMTTSKRLLWFIVVVSLVLIVANYAMAFFGLGSEMVPLSESIVNVVIATVVIYLTKSGVENISKYNPKFGGTPEETAIEPADDPEPEDAGIVEVETVPTDTRTVPPVRVRVEMGNGNIKGGMNNGT